jgi:small subunit ribosomal protein S6
MAEPHRYTLTLILDPNLNEGQLQIEKDAVNALLARVEGQLVEVDEWGLRRLAYPIRKLGEGHYAIYTLKLPSGAPKALESALRLRDNVMRALVVRDRPEWRTRKTPEAKTEATPAA